MSEPVTILVESDGNTHKHRAELFDLSQLGLKLKADNSLVPGQMTELVFDTTA